MHPSLSECGGFNCVVNLLKRAVQAAVSQGACCGIPEARRSHHVDVVYAQTEARSRTRNQRRPETSVHRMNIAAAKTTTSTEQGACKY